uniref:Uncharacterized protein n=1 Tax=Micrurus lemniscatus lemniscatus TaxID=129467 RepID=A0A2D4H638_MICLE
MKCVQLLHDEEFPLVTLMFNFLLFSNDFVPCRASPGIVQTRYPMKRSKLNPHLSFVSLSILGHGNSYTSCSNRYRGLFKISGCCYTCGSVVRDQNRTTELEGTLEVF